MNERLELSELIVSFLKTVNIELRDKELVLLERNEPFKSGADVQVESGTDVQVESGTDVQVESGIDVQVESGIDVKSSSNGVKYYGYQCPSANIVFSGINGYLTGAYLEMDGLVYRAFETFDKHGNAKRSLYINHIKDGNLSQNGIIVEPYCSQQFSTTCIGDFTKKPYNLMYIGCTTSGVILSTDDGKFYGKQLNPLDCEEVFSEVDDNYGEIYKIAISKAINKTYKTDEELRKAFLKSSSIISDTYETMAEIPLRFENRIRATLDGFENNATRLYRMTGNIKYLMQISGINARRKTLDLYISSYLKAHDANTEEKKRISYHTLYY